MSMYATTHEECVDWFPLGDYLEIYQACGERSSAVSVGYRHGREAEEFPGAAGNKSDAIVVGALEVNRYWRFSDPPVRPVPEPVRWLLLLSGVLMLAVARVRRGTRNT